MQNITDIGVELWVYDNPLLECIEALENITPESIVDLHIYCNPMLSECDISNICEYLSNPAGTVEIYNNAPGCNNQQQIQDSCDVIPTVNEMIHEGSFTISPNPFEEILIISYHLSKNSPVSITVHDISGRLISKLVNEYRQQGSQSATVHADWLKPGIYFCILESAEGMQTRKMIKLE